MGAGEAGDAAWRPQRDYIVAADRTERAEESIAVGGDGDIAVPRGQSGPRNVAGPEAQYARIVAFPHHH